MAKGILKGNRIWWFSLIIWVALAGILSSFAPGAKDFVAANKDAGLPADAESIIADRQLEKYFPDDDGLPLFAVFSKESGLTDDEILMFTQQAEDLKVDKKYGDIETIPLSHMPPEVRDSFLSENKRTFFLPITLPENLESKDLHAAVDQIKMQISADNDVKVSWTGPAGIAADAVELFSRADIVLLLSTVGLILVLLLLIYRSPLLTLIPLVGAAIVYTVVDKMIGLATKAGLFTIDSQAVSIMTILLFAVVTDYSLLIFSRYREELRTHEHKSAAIRETMRHVKEPIFFSGSTIVLGVATLFFALYEPYRNFAPAFVIAAAFMLIAGLTLLPALFALTGRKAFWPVIPKYGDEKADKKTIWGKIADKVTKRPVAFLIPLVLLLALAAWNMTKIEESYDLIASFPEDLSSRIGYEQLGKDFSEGSLAPGTLLFVSDHKLEMQDLQSAIKDLEKIKGVDQVTAQGHPFSEDGKSAKLSLLFKGNPYEHEALDAVKTIREKSDEILKNADLADTELFVSGESAKNTDLRDINKRDTIVVMVLMIVLISVMLGLQTRSIIAPVYMMGTILLSYAATVGLSLFLFKVFLGLDAISYRIPLYALVFLIALGVDYSIMLIARIREEVSFMPFADAVRKGVDRTGGVISSAGLILATTFLVLATMPIYELKLFGFIMALGILIDTFIVRPLLIPAILMLLGKWSFWPKRIVKRKEAT
ncbi:MMPL family transporter [Siminovitchia terrae]|uniref:MMPL family transporter n=1 Tax=Siminovitchia terrae TaxID=1914933 RepID=A0A429XCM9_SIMTE|nr:MMPL family transporter [Siminovitchia terrae]RST61041.1 MMPL family transporter [Siminovitchia terrae]